MPLALCLNFSTWWCRGPYVPSRVRSRCSCLKQIVSQELQIVLAAGAIWLSSAVNLRRPRLPWLAEIHDSQHRAVVGIELDLRLARHPDGPHAREPELSPDVVAGEYQQCFARCPR
jgi:hypothetical protein